MSKPFNELINLLTKKIIKHKKIDTRDVTDFNIYYDYDSNKKYFTYVLFFTFFDTIEIYTLTYKEILITKHPKKIIKLKNSYV